MRLIDADAIKYKCHYEYEPSLGTGIHVRTGAVTKEQIDAMPTIDAVPVVLIKELLTRLRRRRMNLDDDCVDEAWNLTMQMEALNDLLNEWAERKEE